MVYPIAFCAGEGSAPEEEQRERLTSLCRALRGSVAEGTGDGSTYMPAGCVAELAGALCDRRLCEAELRLFADREA